MESTRVYVTGSSSTTEQGNIYMSIWDLKLPSVSEQGKPSGRFSIVNREAVRAAVIKQRQRRAEDFRFLVEAEDSFNETFAINPQEIRTITK